MGEHIVPPGPAGNPRPATLGQQDPTTGKHGHGLVCNAVFRARGGGGQEARQGLVGPIHFIQGIFPEKADILLQNQIACSVLSCSLEPCPQLRQHPGGTSRSLGTNFTHARTTLPHRAADRHLEGTRSRRATSFSLTQFVSRRCILVSSAVRLQAQAAPGSPREPAKQTLNVTTITRRLPQPQHRRHQSCSTSPAPAQPGQGGLGTAAVSQLWYMLWFLVSLRSLGLC